MTTFPVRDLLSGDYVGVSESDAVLGAAELMRGAGETAAVVLRGQDATGVLTAAGILDYLLDGGDVDSTPVSAVMDDDPPTVAPDTSVEAATRQLVGTGVEHVLVEDGSAVVGVLDARDLAMATGPERGTVGEVSSASAVGRRGSAESGEYSTQSICEGCGSFAQDLVNVDGQLLCSDCRTV